jgi:hypothetical protein
VATVDDVRQVLSRAADQRARIVLERALNHRQCVRELHDALDVPDEIIAAVAGVHPGTVRRWRSTDEVGDPRPAQEEGIEQLRTIALVLLESGTFLDVRGVGVWLRGWSGTFGWRPRYEALVSEPDGYKMLLDEAKQFVGPGAGIAAAGLGTESAAAAGYGPPRRELVDEEDATIDAVPTATQLAD